MKPNTLLLAVTLLISLGTAQANEVQIEQLMQLLAKTRSGQARFVERKYIAVLDRPVESSGELSYVAPDRLEMRTLKPKPQAMMLAGDRLTMEQNGRQRTVSLQSYPEAAAFIESIRGTLAGDRAALEKIYRMQLSGSMERWQLVLMPIEERMAGIVRRIRIGGSHAMVDSLAFEQADGDRSEMQISQTSAQ